MTNPRDLDESEESAEIVPADVDVTMIPTEDRAVLAAREQLAFEQISGDAALTNELTDDAAKVLLDWARDETQRLVAATQTMDDTTAQAAMAPKLHQLRRHLRRIARIGGNRSNPTDALHDLLTSSTYPEP